MWRLNATGGLKAGLCKPGGCAFRTASSFGGVSVPFGLVQLSADKFTYVHVNSHKLTYVQLTGGKKIIIFGRRSLHPIAACIHHSKFRTAIITPVPAFLRITLRKNLAIYAYLRLYTRVPAFLRIKKCFGRRSLHPYWVEAPPRRASSVKSAGGG